MRPTRVVLLAGILACQFAVFEAGLRLKGGSEAAPAFQRLFVTDERIGHRLKPGAETRFTTPEFETDIRINSAGLRDDEVGPKAPGEWRIAVLGDSLVMSVQVPLADTFTKRLEQRLNSGLRHGSTRFRVLNAGVQGYGPVEEVLFYERVVRPLRPDVVLVAVFVGNDWMEALVSAPKLTGDRGAAGSAAESAWQWMRRIVRRSMVLQIVRLRARTLLERFGRGPGLDRALMGYVPDPPAEVARGIAITKNCVERIAAQAAEDGARTGVILMPARFQVDDADYGQLEAIARQSGTTLIRDGATDRFRSALAGLPAPVMDALPPLRDAPRRSEIFFQRTVHLTPRGHELLAEALERFLVAERLLPAGAPSAPREPAQTTGR